MDTILGIDEVGRGAWAGPMVVGACVLGNAKIDGLTDSKKLTAKSRERLAQEIKRDAAGIGLGWVSARTIDSIGLSAALKLAARRAVANLNASHSEIIIDGTIRLLDGDAVTLLKKADLLIPSVSAASIVAKVARDTYMRRLDTIFDGYGFAGHVGYGTAAHMDALARLGVAPIHRRSFAPIRALLNEPSLKTQDKSTVGGLAESIAADYLQSIGHAILEHNWKTPRCEIDIVSMHHGVIYFNEVKYRRQANQGGGIAAITPEKLRRMTYAAETYSARHAMRDAERRLSVLTLSGEPPHIESYIEAV